MEAHNTFLGYSYAKFRLRNEPFWWLDIVYLVGVHLSNANLQKPQLSSQ